MRTQRVNVTDLIHWSGNGYKKRSGRQSGKLLRSSNMAVHFKFCYHPTLSKP